MYCLTCCKVLIFIFFITINAHAQQKSTEIKSIKGDTLKIDSKFIADSLKPKDTTEQGKISALEAQLGIKIAKDAISSVITATARDSAIMDMEHNISRLYGKAQVNYEDLQLNAGQISYQQQEHIASAAPMEGSNDSLIGNKGTFIQGSEKFTYDSLQYNFNSKRAIVRNVQTQYGEGFILSQQIKRNPDAAIFGKHSTYTTCALDTPHFGIVAHRLKIVPNKLVVSGPANIHIMGVPTPIVLPFALFPISEKQKSGFILPTYTVEQNRGLGLLNGGYYFYINDYVDLKMQTNLYTKGSYAISGLSNYNKLYHYNGGINISYAFNKTGEDFEPTASITKDFMVNWRHTADAKARPGQSFNASVVLGTSSFYSNNSYDPNQILQNQYQSNISYSKTWQGKPFGLTVSALHNQNTATKQINVTLPSINFNIAQFNPFQNKLAIKPHWYDKITSSYTVDLLNKTTFYDSTFHPEAMGLSDFQTGIRHSVPISASYNVLRYINMSFNIGYNEYWLNERVKYGYNDAIQRIDTTQEYGFFTTRDYNASVNLSTRIYGMKLFKQGKLKGIRHVLTPAIGLSYRPDFSLPQFNTYYYGRLDSSQQTSLISYYPNAIVGTPAAGKSGLINYGLNNNLQIKVKTGADSSQETKNITLIDGLNVGGSYNLAADSFQWSNIAMGFRTNILELVNMSASASFDPYAYDYNSMRRINVTRMDAQQGLARFVGSNISLGANFHSRSTRGGKAASKSDEYYRIMRQAGANEYVDFNIPWSFNVNYSLNATNNFSRLTASDSVSLNHNLTFAGELQLTERWKLTMNSGYNFTDKQLSLTSIDIYRDLHCWAMHFQAFPFGIRKSYNFTLNVKASVLQDLKIMRRRDFRDAPL